MPKENLNPQLKSDWMNQLNSLNSGIIFELKPIENLSDENLSKRSMDS